MFHRILHWKWALLGDCWYWSIALVLQTFIFFLPRYQSDCWFCNILVYILFGLYWSSLFSHDSFNISCILKLWYLSLCHFFFLGLLYPWLWLQHGFLSVEGEWRFVLLRDFSFNIEGYGKIQFLESIMEVESSFLDPLVSVSFPRTL